MKRATDSREVTFMLAHIDMFLDVRWFNTSEGPQPFYPVRPGVYRRDPMGVVL